MTPRVVLSLVSVMIVMTLSLAKTKGMQKQVKAIPRAKL